MIFLFQGCILSHVNLSRCTWNGGCPDALAGHVGGGETPLDTRVSKNTKKGEHQIGGA